MSYRVDSCMAKLDRRFRSTRPRISTLKQVVVVVIQVRVATTKKRRRAREEGDSNEALRFLGRRRGSPPLVDTIFVTPFPRLLLEWDAVCA